MKFALFAAALLLGSGFPQTALAQTIDGRVVRVGDGDTLRTTVDGETLTVRLACIDAAEMAQRPWGEDARRRLSELLPPNAPVKLRVADVDRYGRTVAEVFVGERSANLQMVEEGQAVVYTQYLSACSDSRDEYLRAEEAARQARSGYWSQSDPIMPWEFRRGEAECFFSCTTGANFSASLGKRMRPLLSRHLHSSFSTRSRLWRDFSPSVSRTPPRSPSL